ncbi:hypothetical protein ACG2LH_11315 [Zhouia sp. PK063]|uniref:hypothetical protein n=1 Tax=Zhouia sp. PK063 TaxID=3373602 RepID=UPI0037ADD344
MQLYTNCTSCKQSFKIASNAATRAELQMEKGDEFEVSCKHCGTRLHKHVNDIKAEPNKLLILIGFGLGILVTIVLLFALPNILIFSTAGIAIPLVIWQQQTSAARSFNRYMVRRK